MYVENDSDRALQSYENHILDLSASLRYWLIWTTSRYCGLNAS
jgi:hypothetical protein